MVGGIGSRIYGQGNRLEVRADNAPRVRVGEERQHHTSSLRDQIRPDAPAAGCRVQGAGFRVEGAGLRVQSSEFRDQSSGRTVQASGFRDQGLGCSLQISGLRG